MDEEDLPKSGKYPPMDVSLCDFDDVSYHIVIDKDGAAMQVEMNLPVYYAIEDQGGAADFKEAFGDMTCDPSSSKYQLAVSVDLTKLPEKEEDKEALCHKLSTMKPIVVGGAFNRFFRPLAAGDGTGDDCKPIKYDIRGDTTVYFCPAKDRCTTIFAFNFKEGVDRVVAQVFMQEFQAEARKAKGAPPTKWSVDPPKELQDAFGLKENDGSLGYISFAVLPSHVKDDKKRANVVHVLQTFRSFLQYHIKMSKSFWHSKMRSKCKDLLQVLNRAKIDDPDAAKSKKTASGKTFKR